MERIMKKIVSYLPKLAVLAVVVLGLGRVAWTAIAPSEPADAPAQGILVPELTRVAEAGKRAFDANCASCHGANGLGTDKGPPLIHRIYNPGHHADESFFRAARDGVRRHHWNFGDMPAQPQVTEREVESILAYVREVQRANGIRYEEHRM
jgi:mono/diheme cytochrome c family protein